MKNFQFIYIYQVAVGGKAHKAGVIEGYHITKINGEETFQMNHNDAKSVIKNAGWQFMLELRYFVENQSFQIFLYK